MVETIAIIIIIVVACLGNFHSFFLDNYHSDLLYTDEDYEEYTEEPRNNEVNAETDVPSEEPVQQTSSDKGSQSADIGKLTEEFMKGVYNNED